MADRNPSPPPEVQQGFEEMKGGQIGDTLFSQHWLFQTLLKVIEYTEKKAETHNSCSDDMASVDELPKELEDSVCTLWDMSADKDVAHFLLDFKAKDIFLGIIEKTQSPRLLEIIAGILGNMAFYEDICDNFTEGGQFIHVVLQLLGTTDTPTLIQVIRLIHVSSAHKNAGRVWVDMLKNEAIFMTNLLNILENSLNVDLLKSTLKILYYLLDDHFGIFCQWNCETLVNAVLVSASLFVSLKDFEAIVEYWHVLHLLARAEGYMDAVCKQQAIISQHLRFYTNHFTHNEDPIPPSQHVTGLAAAFATLNFLFTTENPDIGTFNLLTDGTIMQYVKDMHSGLQKKLSIQTEGDFPDPSNWELLFDVLTDTISLSLQLTAKSDVSSADDSFPVEEET